jgi:hypothetical protein
MPLVRRSGSRALAAGLVAIVCTAVVTLLSAPAAHAQSTSSASDLRAEADTLSTRYFAALARVQSLDNDIARGEQRVDELQLRAKRAREVARERALLAYTSSGTQLSTLVEGDDTLDTARRAHLIDRVNAHDQNVYEKMQLATRSLRKQQRELKATRQAQADALDQLRSQGAAIDAKLAQADAEEKAAAVAATAPTTVPAAATETTNTTAGAAPATAATSTSTTTTTVPPPTTPTAPPNYVGTPGTSPHHNDPFLTCVRQRESGGNYSAVNPAGPYLGAYQFLQSTWNLTATHAGRTDLVGVPANTATQYDQDEMAWSLYQWQGMGPWGGHCP